MANLPSNNCINIYFLGIEAVFLHDHSKITVFNKSALTHFIYHKNLTKKF